MKTALQLLEEKNIKNIVTVPSDCTVMQAIQVLAEWNIGAVPVMEGDKMVGIFSERDYIRKVTLRGNSTATTPIRAVMTTSVFCVRGETTASECMGLMSEKRIRHLPIYHEGKMVGVLSIGDLVRAIINEQSYTIEQLESYIYK